jgi:hypothetical protein
MIADVTAKVTQAYLEKKSKDEKAHMGRLRNAKNSGRGKEADASKGTSRAPNMYYKYKTLTANGFVTGISHKPAKASGGKVLDFVCTWEEFDKATEPVQISFKDKV